MTALVRKKWSERGVRFADSTWRLPSNESAVELDVSPIQVVGPFARVVLRQAHLSARVNGRGQSWESGATLYLMQTAEGWVIVGGDAWIT